MAVGFVEGNEMGEACSRRLARQLGRGREGLWPSQRSTDRKYVCRIEERKRRRLLQSRGMHEEEESRVRGRAMPLIEARASWVAPRSSVVAPAAISTHWLVSQPLAPSFSRPY